MKKIGIIRCQQTEDLCAGTADFHCVAEGKGAFEPLGAAQVIGFVSCGGCPGKRAVARAKILKDRGAEIIALASCMGRGTPIQFPCPHFAQIHEAITKAVGTELTILEHTH